MFKVGQKLVCVNDDFKSKPSDEPRGVKYPKKGEIYTVRNIKSVHAIWLVEIVNPTLKYANGYTEKGWYTYHFKPIDETTNWVEEVLEKALVEELELVE